MGRTLKAYGKLWYDYVTMEKDDPLSVEAVRRQAEEIKKHWKAPQLREETRITRRPWQQVMDDRPVRPGWG